jgi:DNA processing protein
MRRRITLADPGYPERVRALARPPGEITLSGDVETPARRIAIVGAREAGVGARGFARELAREIATRGGVIVSGGAKGIDQAAHAGALEAGSATWVVAPTGPDGCYPKEHAGLFREVEARAGCAMIWPFPAGTKAWTPRFLERNHILAALADEIVVVQAGYRSGALSTARAGLVLRRPVWAVTAPPWLEGFEGGSLLVERRDARPVVGLHELVACLMREQEELPFSSPRRLGRVPSPVPIRPKAPPADVTERGRSILGVLTAEPQHLETIAEKVEAHLHHTSNELLTLSLGNVVVEGPPGWFRLALT